MAMAAKMPMMATTIINSMSVKPCCIFLSILTPGDEHEMKHYFRTTACASDRGGASIMPIVFDGA
jgi:hypothetical protein